MGRFSERIGLAEPRTIIQKDSIDAPLRAKIWDVVVLAWLDDKDPYSPMRYSTRRDTYVLTWRNFFERPGDEVPDIVAQANSVLRRLVLEGAWNEVYDLLEFLLAEVNPTAGRDKVVATVNRVLEKYMSAYRFIGDQFVEVTDEEQVAQVEAALHSPLGGVKTHLSKALAHLANRENPDVENSIKESISAVESICSAIVGQRTTLGAALKNLNDAGMPLHPALRDAWSKMYGYASDEDGIRHAMQGETGLKVADALYFVVTCSAFVTLLTATATDLGIELQPVS